VHRLYAHIFYIRDLSIHRLGILEVLESIHEYPGMTPLQEYMPLNPMFFE
jgi:hypothetical protein